MNLKQIRKLNHKSQREVAQFLGIHQSTYTGYETGNSHPSINILIKLADYFRVSVDELVGHQVPFVLNKIDFTDKQLALVEELKGLSDNQCERTQAFVQGLKSEENFKRSR